MIESFLLLIAISLAIAWFVLPESNLEPIIVIVLSVGAFIPLYLHQIRPRIDAWRFGRRNFKFLASPKVINAIEGSFTEFERGKLLSLKKQKFPNYPLVAKVFFEQTQLRLVVEFSASVMVDLNPSFRIGNHDDDEVCLPKQTNRYFLAQFDVTGNGIDEIIFGVIDTSNGRADIEVLIFEYHPPYLSSDVWRQENWRTFEGLRANAIDGEPKVILEKQVISIPRNFRNFEYKWIYAEQRLMYVGTA